MKALRAQVLQGRSMHNCQMTNKKSVLRIEAWVCAQSSLCTSNELVYIGLIYSCWRVVSVPMRYVRIIAATSSIFIAHVIQMSHSDADKNVFYPWKASRWSSRELAKRLRLIEAEPCMCLFTELWLDAWLNAQRPVFKFHLERGTCC